MGARKFASSAVMFYFVNSDDAQFGKPDWLIGMSGDDAKSDLISMDAEDVGSKVKVGIMKAEAEAEVVETSVDETKQKALNILLHQNREGVLTDSIMKAKESNS